MVILVLLLLMPIPPPASLNASFSSAAPGFNAAARLATP